MQELIRFFSNHGIISWLREQKPPLFWVSWTVIFDVIALYLLLTTKNISLVWILAILGNLPQIIGIYLAHPPGLNYHFLRFPHLEYKAWRNRKMRSCMELKKVFKYKTIKEMHAHLENKLQRENPLKHFETIYISTFITLFVWHLSLYRFDDLHLTDFKNTTALLCIIFLQFIYLAHITMPIARFLFLRFIFSKFYHEEQFFYYLEELKEDLIINS